MENDKRGKSKNTGCQAQLIITIKLSTKNTKKKDSYLKDGYAAVIEFKGEHNHTIMTAEATSFLRPRDDVRSRFESYFSDGLGLTSINFHESKLALEFGIDSAELGNARINPKYRTVQHLFNEWRTRNLGPRFGVDCIDFKSQNRN